MSDPELSSESLSIYTEVNGCLKDRVIDSLQYDAMDEHDPEATMSMGKAYGEGLTVALHSVLNPTTQDSACNRPHPLQPFVSQAPETDLSVVS